MLSFLLDAAILFTVYGLISLSLNMQAGVTGLINFGQVAFVGIGAYAVAICSQHHLGWPFGFAAGIVVSSIAGALIGRLGRTLAAEYWAIATLALAELVRLVALNQDSLTGGAQGIGNVPGLWPALTGTTATVAILLTGLLLLAVAYAIADRVSKTQFGRVLRTVREDPDLAAALGHNVVTAKVRVLALSAPIAAVAGGFYAKYISYTGPSQLVPFETFLIFTMIVVGGLGSTRGALVGAALITALYDATRFLQNLRFLGPDQTATLRILSVGVILLGFLLLRTNGLLPERPRSFHADR